MKKYLFFKNSAFPRIPRPDSALPFGIFPRISTGTVTPLPNRLSACKKRRFPPPKQRSAFQLPRNLPVAARNLPDFHAPKFFQNLPIQTRTLKPLPHLHFFKVFQSTGETLSRSILPKSSFEDLKRQRDIHGFAKTGVRQLLRRVFPCGALLSNPPQPAGGFLRRVHNPP